MGPNQPPKGLPKRDSGEEKSLRHVAMVASNFIDLIQFHLICQMLAKLSWFNPKEPYLSLEKEKETFFCCVHLLRNAGAWN